MTTSDIIFQVRKKAFLLLLATVVTFCISCLVYIRTCVIFKSETSFYINENVVLTTAMGHVEGQEMSILTTIATNKVLLLISSDELRDSIIKDFDLYKHYYIDHNGQFARENVLFMLNRRVTVRREPNSISLVHLTVEDGDRFVAAGIANKIVERVNLMNKRILENDLKSRALQYESMLPSLQEKATDSRRQFFSYVDSISPGIASKNQDYERLPVKSRVIASDLAGKMDKNSSKYDEILDEYYGIMGKAKTVSNDEWQCITVVKKALPDISIWKVNMVLYSLGVSLFALLCYICLLVYYYQNKEDFDRLQHAFRNSKDAK